MVRRKLESINPNSGHRARLRQRFTRAGAQGFSDYELLELLLTYAIPRRDTKPLAKRLVATFGSLHGVLNAPTGRLASIDGMGDQSAVLLRLVRDLHRPSISLANVERPVVASTKSAVEILRGELASATEEKFVALLLDVSSKLLRILTLAEGTIDRAAVYPRQLIEEVIKVGAAAVIVGHNHPHASPEPSDADRALTLRLCSALQPIEADFLDHIIIGENGYYSFASHGELANKTTPQIPALNADSSPRNNS